MTGTMRALVARQGEAVMEDRPVPRADVNDVVVRTTAASMCSADVACVTGEFAVDDGRVLGHEAVGVVHEIGERVTGFTVGQRVAVTAVTPCGRCRNCQRGHGGHCRGEAWGGYSFGMTRDGSLAEYFVVPDAEVSLVPIPDAVDDALAVCVADTFATGTTGPETARFPLGATVAVFGQGHIGLGATAAARLLGAGAVITLKARPGHEDISRAMGADHTLNFQEHDPLAVIAELTGGEGVDCAIEATGVKASFPNAVAATRVGGVVTVMSSYSVADGDSLPIPLELWGYGVGDKTILSTFARSGSERLERLLRLLAADRVDLKRLLTHEYEFGVADRALHDLRDRRPGLIKPLITFP